MIHLDFETRSLEDLRKTGSYRYSEGHTDVWCMAYQDDQTNEKGVWKPGDPIPELFKDPFQTYCAWNARFERDIYNNILIPTYGFPELIVEQWRDPSAVARYQGLPGSLANAGKEVGLPVDEQKDVEGRKLMLQMARPRKRSSEDEVVWWDSPEKVDRLVQYCQQDVESQIALHKKLGGLPPNELKVFWLDQHINDRGVRIDLDAVYGLIEVLDLLDRQSDIECRKLTAGEVDSVSKLQQIKQWILQRTGREIKDFSQGNLTLLIDEFTEDPTVQALLKLRKDSAKTSTAKIRAMAETVSKDGRIHGMMMYYGAHTGRWTSRLVQLQNLPQGIGLSEEEADSYLTKIKEEYQWQDHELPEEECERGWLDWIKQVSEKAPPMEVISSLIRPLIIPADGHTFYVYDYKAIEPRVLAWISGEDKLLSAYKENRDVYSEMASVLYGIPIQEVTKQQRQFGKVVIIACGYQMGVNKFSQTCASWGIKVTEEEASIAVKTYREYYSKIPAFWYALQNKMTNAFKNPGSFKFSCGFKNKLKFFQRQENAPLQVMLPSNRVLHYQQPIYDSSVNSFSDSPSLGYHTDQFGKWVTKSLYGGLLAENIVQAISRDLMADAMLRLDAAGYPVVFSVHDEIVCEVPVGFGSTEEFESIMTQAPEWAAGLPVEVEGYTSSRYRK